ncbi:cytochrome P450 [Ampelomyces quisqualis]|uniref:Cytochrome P450 n=1 Tax=Ampelomyces quisqualis TaxID=50730 RepID=A0A6A5QTZ5_AMPQU|nr:cytochrome P450 [Ampelomyces quisqualis]
MAFSTASIAVVGLLVALCFYLASVMSIKVDAREPPVIYPRIPFFGHIVGMLTEGPLYHRKLGDRYKYPIFTLPMLNGRSYVVTEPTLAVAVQRASSTLDFDELVVEMTPRLVGLGMETKALLADKTAKEEGRTRMVTKAHSIVTPPLAAHQISVISEKQLAHFSGFANGIKDGQEAGLYKLVTTEVVAASMYSFYGPQNPFAVDPDLINKYWDWDDGSIGYAMQFFPKITARKAYYAMEACVKGWIEYTKDGRHSQAQPFLRDRMKMHYDEGISLEEHARLEMGISLGFNSNASVTSFWVINNVFSDAKLLQEIREEIYANAFEAPGTIYYSRIKDACPLLNSVWRETMRIIAPMVSARIVLEDILLADTYLLRKGNIVQIAGTVMHSDTDIWGPDASSFNARRFFHSTNGTKSGAGGSKAGTVHPAAYRSFGGGTSLCPGRHFAQMEITSLAAVMTLGFDMLPEQGRGWNPPKDEKRFPLVVMKPTRDVKVSLRRRKGWEDVEWDLRW